MEKMMEIREALDALAECGHSIMKTAEALKRYYAVNDNAEPSTEKVAPEKTNESPEPASGSMPEYSKEYVRKLLAKAANNGHREAVKDIIQKHGANSLSQLDPSKYASIVKDAEVLANA